VRPALIPNCLMYRSLRNDAKRMGPKGCDSSGERSVLSSPKKGDRVQAWYGPKFRDYSPIHGATGIVEVVCKGRPRNHGVRIKGKFYVIPAGNLRKVVDE
jgi:hypothetical protein